MGSLASARDIPFLLIYAIVAIVLTTGVCFTLGRLLAKKSRTFARFISGVFFPVLGFAGGFLLVALAPVGPPPNDAPAMAAFALWILAAFSLPICIVTSFVVFALAKRHLS